MASAGDATGAPLIVSDTFQVVPPAAGCRCAKLPSGRCSACAVPHAMYLENLPSERGWFAGYLLAGHASSPVDVFYLADSLPDAESAADWHPSTHAAATPYAFMLAFEGDVAGTKGGSPAVVRVVRWAASGCSYFRLALAKRKKKARANLKAILAALDPPLATRASAFHHALLPISNDETGEEDTDLAKLLASAKRDFAAVEVETVPHLLKIGVLLALPGQVDQSEILGNSQATPAFAEFLDCIAERVALAGLERWHGRLDASGLDRTGTHTYVTTWKPHNVEVLLHVGTELPDEPSSTQHIAKKRHIGNDRVILVFVDDESSASSFDPSTVTTAFGAVFIVVQPLPRSPTAPRRYRVWAATKSGIPPFLPLLPPSRVVAAAHLRAVILSLAYNGRAASWTAQRTADTTRFLLTMAFCKLRAISHPAERAALLAPRSAAMSSAYTPAPPSDWPVQRRPVATVALAPPLAVNPAFSIRPLKGRLASSGLKTGLEVTPLCDLVDGYAAVTGLGLVSSVSGEPVFRAELVSHLRTWRSSASATFVLAFLAGKSVAKAELHILWLASGSNPTPVVSSVPETRGAHALALVSNPDRRKDGFVLAIGLPKHQLALFASDPASKSVRRFHVEDVPGAVTSLAFHRTLLFVGLDNGVILRANLATGLEFVPLALSNPPSAAVSFLGVAPTAAVLVAGYDGGMSLGIPLAADPRQRVASLWRNRPSTPEPHYAVFGQSDLVLVAGDLALDVYAALSGAHLASLIEPATDASIPSPTRLAAYRLSSQPAPTATVFAWDAEAKATRIWHVTTVDSGITDERPGRGKITRFAEAEPQFEPQPAAEAESEAEAEAKTEAEAETEVEFEPGSGNHGVLVVDADQPLVMSSNSISPPLSPPLSPSSASLPSPEPRQVLSPSSLPAPALVEQSETRAERRSRSKRAKRGYEVVELLAAPLATSHGDAVAAAADADADETESSSSASMPECGLSSISGLSSGGRGPNSQSPDESDASDIVVDVPLTPPPAELHTLASRYFIPPTTRFEEGSPLHDREMEILKVARQRELADQMRARIMPAAEIASSPLSLRQPDDSPPQAQAAPKLLAREAETAQPTPEGRRRIRRRRALPATASASASASPSKAGSPASPSAPSSPVASVRYDTRGAGIANKYRLDTSRALGILASIRRAVADADL
ncbi:uncharacterized protein AMSG_02773 [Thecamonas trahens ATCC 50062]|uniref:Rap-GAP domain-containing protein n=1 Tax=Thecamonas trahens ATCC 50062 TaxID=461836 RepID=A0A0L0D293_THETB|nr:hypothetical protein AMSG_02773 [Thecamonas trahens ATCC 50062]KNC46321.1 hypothetical protein AMSG_02773 [Thecamonas trahens ATCC 50062]|eukprot:XP_013760614.1 hypothetical protein AMSG_02773 [Thecamonas trahens ATCC 50062]